MKTINRRDWNAVTAGHLMARAGFGAKPDVVESCLEHSPEYVVDAMLHFMVAPVAFDPPDWFGPDASYRIDPSLKDLPDRERRTANNRLQNKRLEALRMWWCSLMHETPYPLQEKLTLFWHGHFATSAVKVRSPYALYKQNTLFRSHAAGSFRSLLQGITRDPAMMVYLDTHRSRIKNPNENYARELMELFTLGEGHYTEEDISESARAFTGLRLTPERFDFLFRPRQHDGGPKQFMGRRGRFGPDDIIDIILEQPQAAVFIANKLATYFLGREPDASLVRELADVLRDSNWEMQPMLRALFLSAAFYAPDVMRNQIKSPVQWLIGSCQILERDLPPSPGPQFMLRSLGQTLFAPPNVKGWDGGYAWISTTTLTHRQDFSNILVNGLKSERLRGNLKRRFGEVSFAPASADAIIPPEARTSLHAALTHLEKRFFHAPIRTKDKINIKGILERISKDKNVWDEDEIRNVAIACMQMAQYQLT